MVLFGQSAGADNIFVIATLPEAPTLIRAAISESGGGRDAPSKETVNDSGATYAKALNCSVSDVSKARVMTLLL